MSNIKNWEKTVVKHHKQSESKISALNPLSILSRGYCVISKKKLVLVAALKNIQN